MGVVQYQTWPPPFPPRCALTLSDLRVLVRPAEIDPGRTSAVTRRQQAGPTRQMLPKQRKGTSALGRHGGGMLFDAQWTLIPSSTAYPSRA
ncbi:hypothetical protein CMUS01_08057 [Colletotrichum musicola]|uniref:Uncharacterized protein n=1 Tax=Colletotrichum musicola TaxID=2175873 RepID=A0A8H6KER1_9PEZI|nr:hypothetical protein CMUS01_08057 [Colletotrichum musicola]